MKNPGAVRFLLNGNPVELDFHGPTSYTPTTTLLQYLRSQPHLTGTKEGCAEGDCGACTVVMESINNQDQTEITAIDSCLVFLPMVHGKSIITVEHLGEKSLHPAQQAMVEFDGSQCGYCTPGFVMSIYALCQNHGDPKHEVIQDALTGNLCRCTGYRPIMDAAAAAVKGAGQNGMSNSKNNIKNLQPESLAIVLERQQYFQPDNLEDALRLKNMYPSATVICGATDIALKVTKNDQLIEKIIDLSKLWELQKLEKSGQTVTFGAGLSLEKVKAECSADLPALYDCLSVFGSLQIRNLATLGGNIASASPIGDTAPLLMAYGASVNLVSQEGERSIPVSESISGYRKTRINPNELVLSISIPVPPGSCLVKWYKISKRKDLDISSVSGGFLLKLDDGKVRDIKLYYGGMAEKTSIARHTGTFLMKKPWTREIIKEAVALLKKDFSPISDARASAEGRMVMAKNLLWKLWNETNESR